MLKNEEKETAAECIANCNNDKKCIKTCKEMARNEQKYNELNAKLRELKKLNAKSKYDSLIDDLKDEIKSLNYKGCAKDAKDLFKGQKSELTEKKKGMHQACKELPVKERKGCKEKADAEFDETITGIQQTMRDSLQGCESIKNKSQVSKNKINEYKELKKADKAELKALKVRASGFKTSMKEFSKESRYLALQVKTELKKIRNIKDTLTRKAALKDFRTNSEIVKKSKQIKQDIKNARAEASKLNILIKNKKLSDGSMKLKKISQQYALSKYCKV
jgi:hypothetical protein